MPTWLTNTLRIALALSLPVLFVLTNVRLIMSQAYLNWEYNLPDFPADPFGFTQADRLTYAPIALNYLFNAEGIDFLGRQTFPDGERMYNHRELKHMEDVKQVTRGAMAVWMTVIVIVAASCVALARQPETLPALRGGLLLGSGITIGLLLLMVLYILINFNTFFVQFHQVFFEGDTWLFEYSDTLIRLFPVKFWSDAFMLIAVGALLEGLAVGALAWWRLPAT